MNDETITNRTLQRQLILRDSLVFFTLACITILLFLATLFLFRSFSSHREELGQRWYTRGQRDLAAARATDAIFDLRAALEYAPADSDYQFLLAEALNDAGKIDEATTYFSELREADPGSGPLNLQLARLSAQKKDAPEALHYYRAAIYGTWDADPTGNRRAARLELIRSLLSTGDRNTARTELLIASEDADDDASQTETADLMIEAGDNTSALMLFEKALSRYPDDKTSLEGAGNAAFNLGHYASAERYLAKAKEHHRPDGLSASSEQRLAEAKRILELYPSSELTKAERAERITRLAAMAQTRLASCNAGTGNPGDANSLTNLDAAWSAHTKLSAARLRKDTPMQNNELELIYSTIQQVQKSCKSSSADDMILLKIAVSKDTILQ